MINFKESIRSLNLTGESEIKDAATLHDQLSVKLTERKATCTRAENDIKSVCPSFWIPEAQIVFSEMKRSSSKRGPSDTKSPNKKRGRIIEPLSPVKRFKTKGEGAYKAIACYQ